MEASTVPYGVPVNNEKFVYLFLFVLLDVEELWLAFCLVFFTLDLLMEFLTDFSFLSSFQVECNPVVCVVLHPHFLTLLATVLAAPLSFFVLSPFPPFDQVSFSS